MSYIFDALQKSVSEQPEVEIPSALVATELLETAERKTAAERARGILLETPAVTSQTENVPEVVSNLRLVLDPAGPRQTKPEASIEANRASISAAADQFNQFRSLRPLVAPQGRLVCITDKESLAAEKFRYLGVRLRQLQQNRPLKKVLITSTIPQEGKSMVAANLACALAQRTRQKTLLMDGDLRRPSVAKLFGLGKLPGITEWLQGECGALTTIYRLDEPGVWVLPSGNIARNPLQLMQSGRLSSMMQQLAGWFDWIVIDSPPVLPLADTSIWMRQADGILLVARQGASEKDQLKRGVEAIDHKKLLGAILNSSENTAQTNYYYQYTRSNPVESSSE